MDDIWKTISISIITNGTLLGLFIWVFKRLFDSALNKRGELYKQEIDLINKKNFYQFSKIYDEQAQIIKGVYTDLVYMFDYINYMANHLNLLEKHPELFIKYQIPKDTDPVKMEQYLRSTLIGREEDVKSKDILNRTLKSINDFKNNRIYFSIDVAGKIEGLLNLILFIASRFKDVSYRDPSNFEPIVAEELIESWHKSIILSRQLFPALEEAFRKHVGVY
jgi:hypothetical protein